MAAFFDEELGCHVGFAYFDDPVIYEREVCVTALPRSIDPTWVEVRKDDKDGVIVEGSLKAALDVWGAEFEAAFERAQRAADEAHEEARTAEHAACAAGGVDEDEDWIAQARKEGVAW